MDKLIELAMDGRLGVSAILLVAWLLERRDRVDLQKENKALIERITKIAVETKLALRAVSRLIGTENSSDD